jgi:lipopolysaccharide export LptBFGC system permease protein LptF
MDDRSKSTAKWLIVIACGWTIYGWVSAGNHHFSAGSTDFALASTVFWALAAILAAAKLLRNRRDGK